MDDFTIKVALDSTQVLTGAGALDQWTAAGLRADTTAAQFRNTTTSLGRSLKNELNAGAATATGSLLKMQSNLARTALGSKDFVEAYKEQSGALSNWATQARAAARASTATVSPTNTAELLRQAQAQHAIATATQEAAIAAVKQAATNKATAKSAAEVAAAQTALVQAKKAAEAADKASTPTALALIRAEEAHARALKQTTDARALANNLLRSTASAQLAYAKGEENQARLAQQRAAANNLANNLLKQTSGLYVATAVAAQKANAQVAQTGEEAKKSASGFDAGAASIRKFNAEFKQMLDSGKLVADTPRQSTGKAPRLPQGPAIVLPLTPSPSDDATVKKTAAIDKQVAALQRQAATLGQTARQTKLYELAQAGATPAQLRVADAALKSVEAFERAGQRQQAFASGARTVVGALAAIAAAATAAAFGVQRTTLRLVEEAGSFQDLADQTGGAAEGFASMQQAADVAGISMQQVANSTTRLSQRLALVGDDGKGAAAALRSIGINVADFRKLTADAQFALIAKQLDQFADGTEKAAIASQLLGVGGARQLKVFKELAQQQERGIVLSAAQIKAADDVADANRRVSSQLRTVAQVAAIEVGPVFLEFRKTLVDIAADLLGVDKASGKLRDADTLRQFAQTGIVALTGLIEVVANLIRQLQLVPAEIKAMVDTTKVELDSLDVIFKGLRAPTEDLREFFTKGSGPFAEFMADVEARKKQAEKSVKELNELRKKVDGKDLTATPRADALAARFAAEERQRVQRAEQLASIRTPGEFTRFDRALGVASTDPRQKIKLPDPNAAAKEREARQLAQQELQRDLKRLQETLAEQRDTTQFHNAKMELLYQQGTVSLADQLADRRATMEAALQDELRVLDQEKARLEKALKDPRLASDPNERARLRGQVEDVQTKAAKAQLDAAREAELATLRDAEALRRVREEAESARAVLLEMQGDARGAAQIRINQEQQRDRVLLTQALGAKASDTEKAALEQQLVVRRKIREELALSQILQQESSQITQQAAIKEEQILLRSVAQRLSLAEQDQAIASVRQDAADKLEAKVAELQRIAAANPLNIQLRIQADQAALDLEKARQSIDPALVRLRDAAASTADAIAESIGNAIQRFTSFKDLFQQIEQELVRFATQVLVIEPLKKQLRNVFDQFVTGDSGLAKILRQGAGVQEGQKPQIDTSQVQQALNALQASGIQPATQSLTTMQQSTEAANSSLVTLQSGGVEGARLALVDFATAVQQASSALRGLPTPVFSPGGPGGLPPIPTQADVRRIDNVFATQQQAIESIRTPGDFARFDRVFGPAVESDNKPVPVTLTTPTGSSLVDTRSTGQVAGDVLSPVLTSSAVIGQRASSVVNLAKLAKPDLFQDLFQNVFDLGKQAPSVLNTAVRTLGPEQVGLPAAPPLEQIPNIFGPLREEVSLTASSLPKLTSSADAVQQSFASVPDSLSTMVNGLSTSFSDLFNNFGNGLSSLFGDLGSSLSSLFSGFGGGGGAGGGGLGDILSTALMFFGFDKGGFTGNRAATAPAGIVHGQEFVFSAPAVRNIGVAKLDQLHTKARSGAPLTNNAYQDGGFADLMRSLNVPLVLMKPPKSKEKLTPNDKAVYKKDLAPTLLQPTPSGNSVLSLLVNKDQKREDDGQRYRIEVLVNQAKQTKKTPPLLTLLQRSEKTRSSLIRELGEQGDFNSVIAIKQMKMAKGFEEGGFVAAAAPSVSSAPALVTAPSVVAQATPTTVSAVASVLQTAVSQTAESFTSSLERFADSREITQQSTFSRTFLEAVRETANDTSTQMILRDRMLRAERLSAVDRSSTLRERPFTAGGYTGNVGVSTPAGVVHGGEFVFSAPAVRSLGVAQLEEIHNKAKGFSAGGLVGDERVQLQTSLSSKRPWFLAGFRNGGLVSSVAREMQQASKAQDGKASGVERLQDPKVFNININQSFAANTDRRTVEQAAVAAGRRAQAAISRGTA